MAKKTKPFIFPDPTKDGLKDAVIFCPSKRAIDLYDQEHPKLKPRERMSPKIIDWFTEQALEHGWLNTKHVNAVQTKHTAGFILFNPGFSKVDNQGHIIVVIQKD